KGKNNGVLLFIAKDDRQIRIEVGYGLEGALTDAIAGQIIRREMVPRFQQGQLFEGINAGIDAILAATKNEYAPERSGRTKKEMNLLPFILILLILYYISSQSRRRRFVGRGFPPMFLPGGWGSRSGGWGGSGGFTGGGGSFGGGGASGKW